MAKIRWKWKALFRLVATIFSIFSLITFLLINFSFLQTNQTPFEQIDPSNSLYLKLDSVSSTMATRSKMNWSIPLGRGLWFAKTEEENNDNENNIDPALIKQFLLHLRRPSYRNLTSLNARVLLKANNLLRSPPEIVLLIPSTIRDKQNYLMDTLQNLVQNIAEEEKHFAQILVMLTENPWDEKMDEKVNKTTMQIAAKFAKEMDQGLIEVITPPKEWFPPNLEHISSTLGDPPERMRWRTKQCLDYAFAMLHVHLERPNARFYVQLEDDIFTVPNFVSELRRFAHSNPNFFINEFSNLGFIGRMFHNNDDLFHLAHFILLLYKAVPVDWILTNALQAKFCSLDDKNCYKMRLENVVLFKRKPPIFQHVGKHSSLSGKVQKLFEKDFDKYGKIEIAKSGNPPASKFIDGTNSSSSNSEEFAKKLQALYERFVPLRMDLSKQRKMSREYCLMTIEFDGTNKLEQLRGLRIFFSINFQTPLSILRPTLPNSLLYARIAYSKGNSAFLGQSLDHFLLYTENNSSLQNVSSIQIGLNAGNWQKWVTSFMLTAIQIVTGKLQ